MMIKLVLFISLFYLTQSNPIIYEATKNCEINESIAIDLDLKLIQGNWYELVRTNFIFNENTWHNGFVTIFEFYSDSSLLMALNYSGYDNSNNCQYAEKSLILNENSIKVLSYFNDTLIVYVCVNDSDSMCDLFVWSRQRLNVSDFESQLFYKSLLDTYCLLDDDNLIFSHLEFDVCLFANKTKEILQVEPEQDDLFVIAELSSKQDLIERNQILNQTNDFEIEIALIENTTIARTTTTQSSKNVTFMPINSNIEEESLIESAENNKDIMIIGLKKNGPNSKFDPIYIEIEAGSGDMEFNNASLLNLVSEIGLKKYIQKNDPIFNEDNEENEDMTTISTTTTVTTTTTVNQCPEIECHVTVCNFGHKKDENNCNTCDCLKNSTLECVSSTLNCSPCFYGSFTDVNGCESCACKPRPKPKSVYECPKLDCPFCNYGSIKDEYGCETCICIRPNSLESSSFQCSAVPVCPFGSCKHGSVLNDFGCQTCDCLKSAQPDRDECVVKEKKCQPCPYGYFTDIEGCETCTCKPEWMAPCGQNELNCDSQCQHGTYLDRNGCPSCECLPDPQISSMSCLEMQETNGQTECNNDGTFKAKQCNDQECRCVTKDGIPISDFKSALNESQHMNCECGLALYDVSVFKAVGFKLYCATNGNYEIIQCVGSSCACVNEHGDPLGPSVPIYQKHLLRCEGVFQRVYLDQYLTTMAPTTLTPPLCVYHREQALEVSEIDVHMSIPICDEKGLYEPLQCDRMKKYCWCVNVHNGVELNGSRKTGQIPDCAALLSG